MNNNFMVFPKPQKRSNPNMLLGEGYFTNQEIYSSHPYLNRLSSSPPARVANPLAQDPRFQYENRVTATPPMISRELEDVDSSHPFLNGLSPPSRAANPLVQDRRFQYDNRAAWPTLASPNPPPRDSYIYNN